MKILVTGGAGFIGSAVARHLIADTAHDVVVLDSLTYAADQGRLEVIAESPRYAFEEADIQDAGRVGQIFDRHLPDAVMHLAAETHVDRSIDGPMNFIATNVTGTAVLLEAARNYLAGPHAPSGSNFRFHHVSTDEVFGSLDADEMSDETSPYDPTSPYAASKASADHLVRAWHKTFDLPVVISNTSNNYGPYQFPEKLIPLMIAKALGGDELPIYGDGQQRREWIHVEDHARALVAVLTTGEVGETYCIGSDAERTNLEVVEAICELLDSGSPRAGGGSYRSQMSHVADRPAHDRRYRLSSRKIRDDLDWEPAFNFEAGLAATIEWYLANRRWWESILRGGYSGERLGLSGTETGPD